MKMAESTKTKDVKTEEDHEPRFFDGPELSFLRPASNAPLRVMIKEDRSVIEADAIRCFPMTDPEHFIEIRERDGKTVGILRSLSALPKAQRVILMDALNRRYILPRIQRILILEDKYHYFRIVADTDRGLRDFRMGSPRQNLKYRGPNGFEIKDQSGCRYEIADIDKLDVVSQELFEQIR